MRILAIETSCDETAAAVVEGRSGPSPHSVVLSSVVASQHELHEEYAGVVPEIASRAHAERILPVVRDALRDAGVGLGWVDAVAVGHRPGLIGCLLVGVAAAKALSWSLSRPLIGVDHVHAHLYAGLLRTQEDPPPAAAEFFPALGLVVSGGHTSLYRLDSWTRLTRLGATIDDAMGEAFDKAAAILGLPHPGGPRLDELAETAPEATADVEFPISRIAPGSLDFSFSGLKTAMLYAVRGVPGPRGRAAPPLTPERSAALAAAFRKAAVDAAILKLSRAVEQSPSPYRAILTGGGVTANRLLRRELAAFSGRTGIPMYLPPLRWCVDNAAMIGGLAYHLLLAGKTADVSLQAQPTTAL